MTTDTLTLNREALADQYRENRRRTRALFDLVQPEAYYARPIALRHPIVFYEGHLPAFSLNTLVKKGLGRPGVDERLERLFARGIDPEDEAAADGASGRAEWPSRDEVRRFADACDALILEALANAPLDQPGHPLLHEARGGLRHPRARGDAPGDDDLHVASAAVRRRSAHPAGAARRRRPARRRRRSASRVPAGRATLGARRGRRRLRLGQRVPGRRRGRAGLRHRPARRDERAVPGLRRGRRLSSSRSCGRPAAFAWLRAEGIEHPRFWARGGGAWTWRGMFARDRPAARLARLRQPGGSRRLRPLERAPGCRPRPNTIAPPSAIRRDASGSSRGATRRPTHRAGSSTSRPGTRWRSARHPAGQSAWGVHDLIGNGWEWTSTAFAPFAGLPRRWRPIRSTRRTSSTASTS